MSLTRGIFFTSFSACRVKIAFENLYFYKQLRTSLKPNTMALILPVNGVTPQFGENNFLAQNCTVVGDVITGSDCSIWFNAVVRGDVNSIRLGNKVNIQDG